MQVQAIKANTNFESKRRNNVDDIETFVSMDDSQLRYLAHANNVNSRDDKKHAKNVNKMFWAIPIVDILASATLVEKRTNPIRLTENGPLIGTEASKVIAKTATLGERTLLATKSAAGWAGVLGLVGLYNIFKKSATSNSNSMKNFEKTNPVVSFLIDIGVLIGMMTGLTMLFGKSFANALDKNPEKVGNRAYKFLEKFAKIDETKFAKKNNPKIQKTLTDFIDKTPKLAKTGRFALANSVWILLGAGLLSSAHNSVKKSKRIENNYQQLKQTQFEAAKFLAAKRELENEMLAEKAAAKIKSKPESEKAKPVEVAEIEEIDLD